LNVLQNSENMEDKERNVKTQEPKMITGVRKRGPVAVSCRHRNNASWCVTRDTLDPTKSVSGSHDNQSPPPHRLQAHCDSTTGTSISSFLRSIQCSIRRVASVTTYKITAASVFLRGLGLRAIAGAWQYSSGLRLLIFLVFPKCGVLRAGPLTGL
jgi:hypothetical protein